MQNKPNETARSTKNGGIIGFIKTTLFEQEGYKFLIPALLLLEFFLNIAIVYGIKYTEIDWIAYMEEVEGVIKEGQLDYMHLKGQTGPLVYPAGFVYVFTLLWWITDEGKDIFMAQLTFIGIYLAFMAFVFFVYRQTKVIPPYVLILLCMSRRIHSIFVLRLFNDCIAMMFLYLAVAHFTKQKWSWGCFWFSAGVSMKMNVLLFAPGLLLLLLKTFGIVRTIPKLTICAALQVVLGAPFLLTYPVSYFKRAFDFGREFFYIWTVNWKFVPEDIFLSKSFALVLLSSQLLLLVFFAALKWCRTEGGLIRAITTTRRLTAEHIVTVLFTSNFIGIFFSRTLHFQFYVWYFHTLPYLLWRSVLPVPLRFLLLLVIEVVWNIFPSNKYSSATLFVCHSIIMVSLLLSPLAPSTEEPNVNARKGVKSKKEQ